MECYTNKIDKENQHNKAVEDGAAITCGFHKSVLKISLIMFFKVAADIRRPLNGSVGHNRDVIIDETVRLSRTINRYYSL